MLNEDAQKVVTELEQAVESIKQIIEEIKTSPSTQAPA